MYLKRGLGAYQGNNNCHLSSAIAIISSSVCVFGKHDNYNVHPSQYRYIAVGT